MPIACRRISLIRLITAFGLLLSISSIAVADSRRVITLAPHLTELVYAIGAEDQLVGVVEYSDYPAQARSLPRIGDAFRFDLETILVLDADLALAWRGGTSPAVANDLERLGIEVQWVRTESIADISAALRQLGQWLAKETDGHAAAEGFEQEFARLQQTHGHPQPSMPVFYQISSRPLYTLGGRHLLNEALATCGMHNIFADLDVEAAVVDREAVIDARPDLIIGAAQIESLTADWRPAGDASLIQAEIRSIDPDLMTRPSPRILEGIQHLCELRTELSGRRIIK